jgi:predicted metalloprotease
VGCASSSSSATEKTNLSQPETGGATQAGGGGATKAANGAILLQQGKNVIAKLPAGFSCPDNSLDGCFSESTMATYFADVLPVVDKFFETTWHGALKLPAHVYFIADGVKVKQACIDTDNSNVADDTAYEYCPADNNVYIGQHIAYELYSQAGDVAPAVGIAHEFGHYVQEATGVPDPRTTLETRNHENQADCVSGAWLGYADDQNLVEPEDIPSTEQYLELIASSEDDPNRDHGDFTERTSSLLLGTTMDVSACNTFYPDTPISKS